MRRLSPACQCLHAEFRTKLINRTCEVYGHSTYAVLFLCVDVWRATLFYSAVLYCTARTVLNTVLHVVCCTARTVSHTQYLKMWCTVLYYIVSTVRAWSLIQDPFQTCGSRSISVKRLKKRLSKMKL